MTQSQKDSIINEAVKEFDARFALLERDGELFVGWLKNRTLPKQYNFQGEKLHIPDSYQFIESKYIKDFLCSKLSKAIDLAEKAALEERENIEG